MNFISKENSPWEQRSRHFGDTLQGVLFKNLPQVINEHIHHWHVHVLDNFIKSEQPKILLDMGCGYGRLSEPLIKKFPLLKILGLDVSPHYVELYHKRLHLPAHVASVENIPDDLGKFDCILMVTVLMYVPKVDIPRSINKLCQHLNPEGSLMVIEPDCSGRMFQNPFGLTERFCKQRPSEEQIDTSGCCFHNKEIEYFAQQVGGRIIQQLRIPLTTMLIVPIYFLSKILPHDVFRTLLKMILFIDKWLGRFRLPSLHTAYLIKKAA